MNYYNIDVYSRSVSTTSSEAQIWFDRGLGWTFAYNHDEAIACFKKALEHDADCAMAHWGIAYAVGPNYNFPWHLMDPAGKAKALTTAYDATVAALALVDRVTPVERDLIAALTKRYPQRDPIEDQSPWNDDFTDAMRDVLSSHPGDLEVQTVFVESIMNRTPWKMWDLETGGIAEGAGTVEARNVLEQALADGQAAWQHPGILHLYIHLMEMSPFPEKALQASDALRELVPDAGHLIHMPTHIDILCGDYHNVLVGNQNAIRADRKFLERSGAMNFYSAYRIHNYHFAIYGAMYLGQFEPAMAAAQELINTTPEELLRLPSPPMADFMESYISMKQHVLIRFGKWREIITQEPPEDQDLYCVTTAMMRYAKSVAHSALGEIEEAEREKALFLEAKTKVPDSRLLHNNKCYDLLAIAEEMLEGELTYRCGDYEAAFAHLRRSVELDDALPYDEPWGWIQPSRHALGALLLEQNQVEEAEAVYREDLGLGGNLSRATIHPDNVWSLSGLYECLTRRGEEEEALLIRQRLDFALARADGPIRASCFCAQAAMAG